MPTAHSYPNKIVNRVVYETPATAQFTPVDWLDLAMAAIDQSGLRGRDYDRIKAIVEANRPALEPTQD